MTDQQGQEGGSSRGIGLFALVGSCVLAYMFVYEPYVSAVAHAPSVSLSLKGVAVVPLIFVFGMLHGVFPAFAEKHFGGVQTPRLLWWVFSGVLVVAGFVLYWWLRQVVAANGYAV